MTTTPLPPLPRTSAQVRLAHANNTISALEQARADLEAELSAHKAARIAYASEFPLNGDGEPDVGSIHYNIRKLKVENARLRHCVHNSLPLGEEGLKARAALENTK